MSDRMIENDLYEVKGMQDWSSWTNRKQSLGQSFWAESMLSEATVDLTPFTTTDLPHNPKKYMITGKKSTRAIRGTEYQKLWARRNDGITYKRRLPRRGLHFNDGIFTGIVAVFLAFSLIALLVS